MIHMQLFTYKMRLSSISRLALYLRHDRMIVCLIGSIGSLRPFDSALFEGWLFITGQGSSFRWINPEN